MYYDETMILVLNWKWNNQAEYQIEGYLIPQICGSYKHDKKSVVTTSQNSVCSNSRSYCTFIVKIKFNTRMKGSD